MRHLTLVALLLLAAAPAYAQQPDRLPTPVEYLSTRMGQVVQTYESQIANLVERLNAQAKELEAARKELADKPKTPTP